MANRTPPMYTDAPLALIHTPKFETGKWPDHSLMDLLLKDDPFTIEASHMALSHNSFIRGFNSIYQQAPRVQSSADKSDFVGYCLAWIECVATHHHYEETEFFPNVDKDAGQNGLMGQVVHEHEEFQGGMDRMKDYLLQKEADFSGDELIAIMDSFKQPLHSHLKAEPGAIVALAKYSTSDHPIDILAIAGAAGKKQVNLGFMFNTLPVFFLNMETATFEGGMWEGVFPPLKGMAKTVMNKLVPMWQSRRWRFVSCTPDGEVGQLAV
ncbi:Uu.00g077780.m01.CDS01 [Anthostomella pinea]|uniref:Uu.00g077780.m01.CDS01 n=1 Tax=Anthostomella pinea TaxID=933095 RepID=A0AAI8VL48_9PEZI|nr:Uu.00g077780.m01.CDS01 [Anthostomella pinea]